MESTWFGMFGMLLSSLQTSLPTALEATIKLCSHVEETLLSKLLFQVSWL